MTQTAAPSEFEFLRARAQVCRLLVREGRLAPEDALALTVWPTRDVVEAEGCVNRYTVASRAYSALLNA